MTDSKKVHDQHQLTGVLSQISDCQLCKNCLPNLPRPVLQAGSGAKLLIIGQAPGQRAHDTTTPWNDPSGDRLRDWLGLQREHFYDANKVALIPMGFCYPGRGKSGDLPPTTACAPTWHPKLFSLLETKLILLVGQYAQSYYLKDKFTLTKRVKQWESYMPTHMPLPHPSPRNNIWLKRNDWFEERVLPALRQKIKHLLR